MRLIDAEKLWLTTEYAEDGKVHKYYEQFEIDAAPTIDAEPVIRCKDCRWGREVYGDIECSVYRNQPPEYHGYEWFCPYGERRTNEVVEP